MDVLTSRSRAGVAPSGFSLVSRRLGDLAAPLLTGRRLTRAGLGLSAGVMAGLAGGWVAPALGGCVGLLFGWPGLAAFAVSCFLTTQGLRPDLLAAFVAAMAAAAPGVSMYLTFRSLPDLGRGLPNLRSHLWLLGGALLGGPRRRSAHGSGRGERGVLRLLEPGGGDRSPVSSCWDRRLSSRPTASSGSGWWPSPASCRPGGRGG